MLQIRLIETIQENLSNYKFKSRQIALITEDCQNVSIIFKTKWLT
jgi:hypothetical protein